MNRTYWGSVPVLPNVPELFQKHRAHSAGEIIADAAVHAIAIVAGMIGFAVLFQKIALHGAAGTRWRWRSTPRGSSCCSASPAPTT